LHPGHFIRRGIEITRWDLRNNNFQCNWCNSKHEEDPEPYMDQLIMSYGVEVYRELKVLSNRNKKFTYTELLDVRDGLRRELRRLQP
jgi:hypothetical protein